MNKLLNILAIIVVLALAVASRPATKASASPPQVYVNQARDWFYSHAWPQMGGEVAHISNPLKQEIANQKNNFFQDVWEGIEDTLAKKFSEISGTNVSDNNCPVPNTQ